MKIEKCFSVRLAPALMYQEKRRNNMKLYVFGLTSLLIFSGVVCLAQEVQPAIIEDFKPSTLNQPGQQYPQVN